MLLALLLLALASAQELHYAPVTALHADPVVPLPARAAHVTGGWCTDLKAAVESEWLAVHCYWLEADAMIVVPAMNNLMRMAGYTLSEDVLLPNGLTITQTWVGEEPGRQPLISFTVQPLPWDVSTTMLVTLSLR